MTRESPSRSGPFASDQQRSRCIKISGERKALLVQCDAIGIQRIDELQARFAPGEADDPGNRRGDPTKFVLLAEILALPAHMAGEARFVHGIVRGFGVDQHRKQGRQSPPF